MGTPVFRVLRNKTRYNQLISLAQERRKDSYYDRP
jgi:hypothetical protein